MDLDGARIGLDALERAKRTGELRRALADLVAKAKPILIRGEDKDNIFVSVDREYIDALNASVERAKKELKK